MTLPSVPASSTIPRNERLKRITKKAAAFALFFSALVVSFCLTHIRLSGTALDYKNFPAEFQVIDKAFHIVFYAILSSLLIWAFTLPGGRNEPRSADADKSTLAGRLLLVTTLIVLYGIFDEVSQPMFGRRFEVLDLAARMAGIALGQALFVFGEVFDWRQKLEDLS